MENSLLCAISTHILRVIVVRPVCVAPIALWAFWHLPCHRHSNDFQPALLVFVRFSSKVVDGLGLGKAEAGWRVCGPGALIHRVSQEGDGRLGLHVLRERRTSHQRECLLINQYMRLDFCFVLLVFTCGAP